MHISEVRAIFTKIYNRVKPEKWTSLLSKLRLFTKNGMIPLERFELILADVTKLRMGERQKK